MYNSTFSRVECNSHSPLLPLQKVAIRDGETGTLRLDNGQGLEILSDTPGKQFGDIFALQAMVHNLGLVSFGCEAFPSATCSGFFDAHNRLGCSVHNRDKRQGVGIEVGVGVPAAGIPGKHESLEVAVVAILNVRGAVGPWLHNDLESLWQLELRDLLLEESVCLNTVYKFFKLLAINAESQ
jgi:hypothetical protein